MWRVGSVCVLAVVLWCHVGERSAQPDLGFGRVRASLNLDMQTDPASPCDGADAAGEAGGAACQRPF
jgi:hypothetical protein